jgi:transcription initiation factor TFIID subunit 7
MDGPTPGLPAEGSRHPSSFAAMPPPPVPTPRSGGEVSYFNQHAEAAVHPSVGQKAPAKRPGRITIKKSAPSTQASGSAPVAVRHSARIPVRSAKARDNMASSARIKLKFSQKGEQHKLAPGHFMSPFGEYTRELDEDPEEPLAFEEQFILRVPKEVAMGDSKRGVKGLNQLLDERKEVEGVWFKFKGMRGTL